MDVSVVHQYDLECCGVPVAATHLARYDPDVCTAARGAELTTEQNLTSAQARSDFRLGSMRLHPLLLCTNHARKTACTARLKCQVHRAHVRKCSRTPTGLVCMGGEEVAGAEVKCGEGLPPRRCS